MRDVLRETVKESLSGKVDTPRIFYGHLGNLSNVVVVPNQPGYVYVTLNDGSVTTAYNTVAPAVLNLPVICGYDVNQPSSALLKVLSVRNIPRQTNGGISADATYITKHHQSHEWMSNVGGSDIVYLELRQFMPFRPEAVYPMSVKINRGLIRAGSYWKYVEGQTISLESEVPTGGSGVTGFVSGSAIQARFALVSLDATSGSAIITSGSVKSIWQLAISDIPATPANNYPICAVRLYYYQTVIAEAITGTDLIDLRWGMFTNGLGITNRPPIDSPPVTDYYLTGYDAVSGSFSSGSIVIGSHNELAGLQGGTSDEYYHLTAAEHTIAIQAAGSGQAGYLLAADWLRFNATSGSGGISDAPIDGKQYGRQDGVWTEISGSQVVPVSHTPVESFYMTGYDATSGSFSSGSIVSQFVFLTSPLTSTDFDGDSFSTTAKTKIDLSDKFGVPAGIKAILAELTAMDSGSALSTAAYFGISPNADANIIALIDRIAGLPDDLRGKENGICPCNADGDIYYQIAASGDSTLDAWLVIWGYWL